jgi:peroxiredoxin Q/BCP
VIKRFGLLKKKTMYGKPVTGVERTTYLIGPDKGTGQRVLHIFSQVTPAGHAEEVFALLKASGMGGPDGRAVRTAAATAGKKK